MHLRDLGFDEWFAAHAEGLRADGFGLARITVVDRGVYRIHDASREVPAELSGRFAHQAGGSAGLPCVGDWVAARPRNEGAAAIIHRVLPRKSFLRRKTPGEDIDHQMIAANVDGAFIVQSCHFDFNPGRLDRYLVMARDGRVEPVVLLAKADLIPRETLEHQLALLRAVAKVRVIALSAVTGAGFEAFQRTLAAGKTYCLLGSSGVGKTTLVNRLLGREAFETGEVSRTGEGVHTTTRRQLVVLDQGALLIDTPGMRELGLVGAREGLRGGFEELAALAARCRYADCSHQQEPGCAVRAAVETGALREARYASYLKLKKESEFHAMSLQEKRKKDRDFGRFKKSAATRRKG